VILHPEAQLDQIFCAIFCAVLCTGERGKPVTPCGNGAFEIHPGEHATSALRAIFALSAWPDVPWPTGAG